MTLNELTKNLSQSRVGNLRETVGFKTTAKGLEDSANGLITGPSRKAKNPE